MGCKSQVDLRDFCFTLNRVSERYVRSIVYKGADKGIGG